MPEINNSDQEQLLTGYTSCIVGENPNVQFIMVSKPSTLMCPYVYLTCIIQSFFYILAHGRSNN